MVGSEENLDFMLFLDNHVPEIEKPCIEKCFLKKGHIRNIVNETNEEILREFFSDVFLRRFGEDLRITLI